MIKNSNNHFRMDKKSAIASDNFEYDKTLEEMLKDDPEMLLLNENADKYTLEEIIAKKIKYYTKK